jgi:hypothetical protein
MKSKLMKEIEMAAQTIEYKSPKLILKYPCHMIKMTCNPRLKSLPSK